VFEVVVFELLTTTLKNVGNEDGTGGVTVIEAK
jgi:hypothetical protein